MEGVKMRVDTVQYKVYSFDELSDEGKEAAIQNLWDSNVDYEWWDFTYDDAKTIGLKIDGFDLDRNRHATGCLEKEGYECAELILKEHGKDRDTFALATNFLNDMKALENQNKISYRDYPYEDEYIELVSSFEFDLLEEYSILLQKEYEYLTSEEAIVETIKANEYEFTADGKLY
jgi:hypothetical protein